MVEQCADLAVEQVQPLIIPRCLQWLKWKVCCFLSNIFFTRQCYALFKKKSISYIYQRYAVLNCTGTSFSVSGLRYLLY